MWRMMARGPWLSTLPLSLAVHAAGVVLVFLLGSGHIGSSVLVVDLSEPLVAQPEPPLPVRRPASPPPRVTRAGAPRVTPAPGPASPPSVSVVEPEASDRRDAGPPGAAPAPVDREVPWSPSPPSPPPPGSPPMEPAPSPLPSPALESPARLAAAPTPLPLRPARGDEQRGRRHPEPGSPGRLPETIAEAGEGSSAFPASSAAAGALERRPAIAAAATTEATAGTSSSPPGGGEKAAARATPSTQSGSGAGGAPGTERDGTAVARAVPGSGGGHGAEYSQYLASLRQRIFDGLRYPAAARRRSMTGTVHLEIVIEPSGAVGSVIVVESSSHSLLDEAAVDAVRRLSPLPFPRGLAPRTIRARLPIVFDLR